MFMQRVKRALLVPIACFIVAAGYAQDSTTRTPGEVFDLRQCVDLAIKGNTTVKTAQFTMETDKTLYQQSIGQMLPFAQGQVSHQQYDGRNLNPTSYQYVSSGQLTANYSLSANITLWNGSSLEHYLQQNRQAYHAGEYDLQQARDAITIQVILDYINVLSAKEQLSAALAQDSATREQVRVYKERYEAGSVAPGDYFTLKGQLSQNDVTVATATNALATAKLTLSKDMNIEYSSSLEVVPIADTSILQPYGSSVDDMYAYSVEHLPQIKSVDLKEQSALSGVKATRGALLPALYLIGGAGTNYSNLNTGLTFLNTTQVQTSQYVTVSGNQIPVFSPQDNYNTKKLGYGYQISNNIDYYVGLQLNIPILNGLSARTRLRQAKITEDQAHFNRSTTRIQLRQAIETDYVNMASAFNTYKALAQGVLDYTQSYNAALAKLDAGSISAYEFVQVKSSLDAATLNLIGTKYNYILQTKILDYYMGRLSL
jgi:outer membrane protein